MTQAKSDAKSDDEFKQLFEKQKQNSFEEVRVSHKFQLFLVDEKFFAFQFDLRKLGDDEISSSYRERLQQDVDKLAEKLNDGFPIGLLLLVGALIAAG